TIDSRRTRALSNIGRAPLRGARTSRHFPASAPPARDYVSIRSQRATHIALRSSSRWAWARVAHPAGPSRLQSPFTSLFHAPVSLTLARHCFRDGGRARRRTIVRLDRVGASVAHADAGVDSRRLCRPS